MYSGLVMDCRTFHRNLEDYLEGGLDFSGRFGMERHAQQCIGCGKELAGAQRLHRMASELQRVKAPPNFEVSVLNEIARRKSHGRFFGIRSLFIYGIEWPSWRKLALASSGLAALGLGVFFLSNQTTPVMAPVAAPLIAGKPVKAPEKPAAASSSVVRTAAKIETQAKVKPRIAKQPKAIESSIVAESKPKPLPPEEVDFKDLVDPSEMEYVEYEVPSGQDGHAVFVRLPMPKKIRMRYGQASEEEFIRNVSH